MTKQALSLVLLVVALAAVISAVLGDAPPGWVPVPQQRAAAIPSQVSLTLHLFQRNLGLLDRKFWEVSDPSHRDYGKYLNIEEISRLVAPDSSTQTSVEKWLQSQAGISKVSWFRSRDAVRVWLNKDAAERVFAVKLLQFEHQSSGRRLTRSLVKETIPSELSHCVQFVSGLSDFPTNARKSFNKQLRERSVKQAPMIAGAPIIQVPRGIEGAINITFKPVCLNGVPSHSASSPCSDAGNSILSVAVTLSSNLLTRSGQTTPLPQISALGLNTNNCRLDEEKEAVCFALIDGVPNFLPVNVTLQAKFSNSQLGPSVSTAFHVVASPMVTPRTISSLYHIPIGERVTNPKATQSVAEFEQQYYDRNDLAQFFEFLGIRSDTNVTVIGPNNEQDPGVEALLDIEYIMGLAPGSPTTFWSIRADSPEEIDDILEWCYEMGNTTNPPIVNSISYGMGELNVPKYFGKDYLSRTDTELKKLALRGITIVIASGDTGAGDLGGPPMGFDDCKTLHADWPSNSQYVLSVGSTFVTPMAEPMCLKPEVRRGTASTLCLNQPYGEATVSLDAGMRWTTGGGFSEIIPQPSYQSDVVEAYFASGKKFPPHNAWNSNGRAYPDVAAVGHNLMVISDGVFLPVDGTSASAPIFAAILSLLNSARLEAGLPLLGFVNPLLYQIYRKVPAAWNDVVVGNNACGAIGTVPACCDWGFEAAPGWDAVTGLGTPNYVALKEAVLKYKTLYQ